MPQIQIEHDIGDTVYVVTSENPRKVMEGRILSCFVEKTASGTRLSYGLYGLASDFCDDRIFKDPWSAFNHDAPRAEY